LPSQAAKNLFSVVLKQISSGNIGYGRLVAGLEEVSHGSFIARYALCFFEKELAERVGFEPT
jgi:hypothetical protein